MSLDAVAFRIVHFRFATGIFGVSWPALILAALAVPFSFRLAMAALQELAKLKAPFWLVMMAVMVVFSLSLVLGEAIVALLPLSYRTHELPRERILWVKLFPSLHLVALCGCLSPRKRESLSSLFWFRPEDSEWSFWVRPEDFAGFVAQLPSGSVVEAPKPEERLYELLPRATGYSGEMGDLPYRDLLFGELRKEEALQRFQAAYDKDAVFRAVTLVAEEFVEALVYDPSVLANPLGRVVAKQVTQDMALRKQGQAASWLARGGIAFVLCLLAISSSHLMHDLLRSEVAGMLTLLIGFISGAVGLFSLVVAASCRISARFWERVF